MATIVRPHPYSDKAVARPDHANENETILFNEFNGNIDWDNLKAALQNAANGFVKLDASAKVPVAQLPVTIPSGIIVMWSGTLGTIPAGWSLCDGTGGTPDLRDKFIYGWTDGVDPGDEGGALTHTHTYSDLPSHSHASAGAHTHTITDPGHTHEIHYDLWSVGEGPTDNIWGTLHKPSDPATTGIIINSGGAHTHPAAGVASPETDAGSTLPPYFKLAFIIKD